VTFAKCLPMIDQIAVAIAKGAGVREAGRLAGVGTTSVLRIRDELRAAGSLEADAL
jgi:hypothetical protein